MLIIRVHKQLASKFSHWINFSNPQFLKMISGKKKLFLFCKNNSKDINY